MGGTAWRLGGGGDEREGWGRGEGGRVRAGEACWRMWERPFANWASTGASGEARSGEQRGPRSASQPGLDRLGRDVPPPQACGCRSPRPSHGARGGARATFPTPPPPPLCPHAYGRRRAASLPPLVLPRPPPPSAAPARGYVLHCRRCSFLFLLDACCLPRPPVLTFPSSCFALLSPPFSLPPRTPLPDGPAAMSRLVRGGGGRSAARARRPPGQRL